MHCDGHNADERRFFFPEAAHIYRFVIIKSRHGADRVPMQPTILNQRIYQHRKINKLVCARAMWKRGVCHAAEQV